MVPKSLENEDYSYWYLSEWHLPFKQFIFRCFWFLANPTNAGMKWKYYQKWAILKKIFLFFQLLRVIKMVPKWLENVNYSYWYLSEWHPPLQQFIFVFCWFLANPTNAGMKWKYCLKWAIPKKIFRYFQLLRLIKMVPKWLENVDYSYWYLSEGYPPLQQFMFGFCWFLANHTTR